MVLREVRLLAAALLLLGALLAVLGGGRVAPGSVGLFTDSAPVTGNAFVTDTLDPPSGLTASGGSSIDLSWTAMPDTYASGHRVLRGASSGGPYSQIAEITPRTTTSYQDSAVACGGTYYYVARAFYQGWESANSNEASATVSSGASGITFRAAAQASTASGTLTISKPSGTVEGDVMLAAVAPSGPTR